MSFAATYRSCRTIFFYVLNMYLDHTIVSTSSQRSLLYVHDEKQLYFVHRGGPLEVIYRCRVATCRCEIKRIGFSCFRNNPWFTHNHLENGEKKFEELKNRAFLIILIKRLLSEDRGMKLVDVKRRLGGYSCKFSDSHIKYVKKRILAGNDLTGLIIKFESVDILDELLL